MNKKSSSKFKKFSSSDRLYLKKQGISEERAHAQIKRFKRGFPFVELSAPCTVKEGVWKLNQKEQKQAESFFKKNTAKKKIIKFVPASGAASRMFGFLLSDKPEAQKSQKLFLKNLPRFAFYKKLGQALKKKGKDIRQLRELKDLKVAVEALLKDKGLSYLRAPKGLVLFHGQGEKARTAFEEQLAEGCLFSDKKGKVQIHFTLPVESRAQARKHLLKARHLFPRHYFHLTDSVQSRATDCLAVDQRGCPVRDEKGNLLLRPAGHGALLQNLNRIKADAVYIKNIDNILPAQKRKEADRWKKILMGVFLETQRDIFKAQSILAQKKMTPEEALETLRLANKLGWKGKGRAELKAFFDRPFRAGGVVVNQGEPGGGPFWVRGKFGLSAQIVESAEVNFKKAGQKKIWSQSTHFNPVEFVCGVCDYRGKKYNLMQHVDDERGIITKKNYQGQAIQAMELPGLWNGSMGNWLTVFVEIPAEVFAPVKTVLDLLRKEHQV